MIVPDYLPSLNLSLAERPLLAVSGTKIGSDSGQKQTFPTRIGHLKISIRYTGSI